MLKATVKNTGEVYVTRIHTPSKLYYVNVYDINKRYNKEDVIEHPVDVSEPLITRKGTKLYIGDTITYNGIPLTVKRDNEVKSFFYGNWYAVDSTHKIYVGEGDIINKY